MSTFIRSALIALVLTNASVATARPVQTPQWTDMSDRYGGHDSNSPEDNKAFWEYMSRHGGN